jgi:anthranilate synthase component 2
MIILIDNYDSFTYNLYHFLGDLGAETVVHRNDKISVGQVISAKPEAIVISPGPATPNEAGICLELIEKASGNIPIFGVCLGMQSMGQCFGGDVVRAPKLMHGKVSQVHHTSQGVFKDLPQDFTATRYHSLIVDKASLPDCLEITAETDGLIMGLQHKTKNVHGVQFHPESIASEHGHKILKNFLDLAGVR